MAVEIKVPALGESVTEATIAKWFKAVGDAVAVDEALVELETDKVTVEVNAPVAGALKSIVAAEGGHMMLGQGGMPILRDGVVVGACGVGGGSAQQDEDCARAGIELL